MPISWKRPSDAEVRAFLAAQEGAPLSYPGPGATRADAAPPGFIRDHSRAVIGSGSADFAAAIAAVRSWTMFALGWVDLCWPDAAISEGTRVAVRFQVLGLHWLTACRVVEVIDRPGRFGFTYGTLAAHVERGEERFLVELGADERVSFEIVAVSRPGALVTWLGYPYARVLQRRFREQATTAMRDAVLRARRSSSAAGEPA